jgi:hypothetical protein
VSDPELAVTGVVRVGPVLCAGDTATALIAALREVNHDLVIVDRGAYLRALAPDRCVLDRAAVERELGRPFRLPMDLELVMPSFQGELTVDDDRAVWSRRYTATEDAT